MPPAQAILFTNHPATLANRASDIATNAPAAELSSPAAIVLAANKRDKSPVFGPQLVGSSFNRSIQAT
ncbi:hypothetical protein Cob_v010363 [Colletotrichum orbiculare MAFF 240422]|uniref:Uncharacterized protein n=1 Tax=Colletotrichum orbiculare (strain 104-T / ATCC 96160 / CBS 514.97 / LARS 414 / MAFF 240422) TaxID=1213857 RepID=A0A484FEV9_COLOR|nr:hypothetical protein Cob_v010363 [Colletotrichum orbiculare MAFF 240422]